MYRNKYSLKGLKIKNAPDLLHESEVIALLDISSGHFSYIKNNSIIKPITYKGFERYQKADVIQLIEQYENEKSQNNLLSKVDKFIKDEKSNLKMIRGDVLTSLKEMGDGTIDLMVTSPPYFNARGYSVWDGLDDFIDDMYKIITESFRVLGNHKTFVFNVGDISCQLGKQPRTKRRIPLWAIFTQIFTDVGFKYVDDYIWDKGEPQSFRQQNWGNTYPNYIYPVNCYEHILIFQKHEQDFTRVSCPVCWTDKIQNNSQSEIGVQSRECNNEECSARSLGNRGKRYSQRSIMMNEGKTLENNIPKEFIQKWRKDIVKFSPVIKIGAGGENKLGHSAPFPTEIPEMSVRFFSYVGDKVLDPFSWSFTSCLVASALWRIGIGIDVNKDFYKPVVENRIETFNFKDFWFKEKINLKYEEIDILDKTQLVFSTNKLN